MLADMAVRASSPVLIGRSGQLAALDAALAVARDGNPAAVLVGGEAGVGKARLVTEFAEHARGAGARVLTGGCLELGTDGLPFAPFTAVLRELVRDRGADGIAGLLPGGTTAGSPSPKPPWTRSMSRPNRSGPRSCWRPAGI